MNVFRPFGTVAVAAAATCLVAGLGCPRTAGPPAEPSAAAIPATPPPVVPVTPSPPLPAPAPAPALSPEIAQRLAAAAAWLLDEAGPPVRLRLFLPATASSSAPDFDAALAAAVRALSGAALRLARVDVSLGPHDDDTVTAMRGLGILPRTGGDPEAVRVLVIAVGDAAVDLAELSPERGPPETQVLLALHRVLRGPVRIGVIAPDADPGAAGTLAAALPGFSLVPLGTTPPTDPLAAIVVLATGAGPLPAGTKQVVDRALAAGEGVVILGGRRVVRDEREARRVVASLSDPSRLLAGTGIALGDGVVVDPSCARVSVPSGSGRLFLSYPPLVRTAVRLPGQAGEATAVFPFASPLQVADGRGIEVLAQSSDESWIDDGAPGWAPDRLWQAAGPTGAQPLAVAVRLPAGSDGRGGGRLVVVSTAKVADRDGLGLDANAGMLAGLLAWAADVEDLLLLGGEEGRTP